MRGPLQRVVDTVQRAGEGRIVEVDQAPICEVALVLGARIRGTQPTAVLDDRLATAAALFHAQKVARLVVSGTPAEVAVMSASLCERDVPGAAQVLDPRGLHTFESVRNVGESVRNRSALGARSMLVVTQRFHLPRALYFAQKLGLDAVGVAADRRIYAGMERMVQRERRSSVLAWARVRIQA